jgi:hypothetical protein
MATVPLARAREHVVRVRVRPPPPWVRRLKLSPEAGRLLVGRGLGAGQWSSRTRLCSVSTAGAASSGRRVNRRFSPTRVFATSQNGAARARQNARPRDRRLGRRANGSRPPRPARRADVKPRCRSSPRRGGLFFAARASSRKRPPGPQGCKNSRPRPPRPHRARFAFGDEHRRRQAGASTFGSARGSLTRVGTRVSVRCV